MSTATAKAPAIAPGPLLLDLLGPAPDARHGIALQRLRGHGSSSELVPAGLFDELDAVRDRHLSARAQLAKRIEAVVGQARLYGAEDRARQADIERAAAKLEDPPADERTPRAERQEAAQELMAQAWASVLVLADRLDEVVATCREHEREWLQSLRSQLPVLNAKRAEAQRVLAEAELAERKLGATGVWLQKFSDDAGAFDISPLTVPQTIPPGAQGHIDAAASLVRPYTRAQPWNEGAGAPSNPPKPMTANPQQRDEDEPPDDDAPGPRKLGAGVGLILGDA